MLSRFPDFTPVAALDRQEFSAALAGHLPYSNFNYVTLRCYWPEAQAARLGDGAALLLSDPATATPFLTLLGRKGQEFSSSESGGRYYQT